MERCQYCDLETPFISSGGTICLNCALAISRGELNVDAFRNPPDRKPPRKETQDYLETTLLETTLVRCAGNGN